MNICFYVGDVAAEKPEYTTTRLALAAARAGHDVFYSDADDFVCRPDGSVHVRARRARSGDTLERLLSRIQDAGPEDAMAVDDVDALMMRAEIGHELEGRPWAATAALIFGGMAARAGVLVVNDPEALALAADKSYLQRLPVDVRPRTLITRYRDDIKEFIENEGGRAVIKPLHGSKGHSVFVVSRDDESNLNQMIDAVLRDGYATAQEFLPGVEDGDIRVLLLDGEPLRVGDAYAAFRRRPSGGDVRSNMSAGARAEAVTFDDDLAALVGRVGPQLRSDGMLFVGLDVIDGKVIEVNAESPGGLGSTSAFGDVDFAAPVIDVLEKKATVR